MVIAPMSWFGQRFLIFDLQALCGIVGGTDSIFVSHDLPELHAAHHSLRLHRLAVFGPVFMSAPYLENLFSDV